MKGEVKAYYFSDSSFPGSQANKVAKINMALGFSQNKILTYFYYFSNQKNYKPLSSKYIIDKKIYLPFYNDETSNVIKRQFQNIFVLIYYFFLLLFLQFSKKDIIFIRGNMVGLCAALLSYIKTIPYCFEIHNYEFGVSTFQDFFFKIIFNRSKYSITVTNYTKQNWIDNGICKDKILVLPSGVNYDNFSNVTVDVQKVRSELGLRSNEIVIGYAGSLIDGKGYREILHAAQQLSKFTFFCFVGNMKTQQQLFQRCKELNIDNIKVHDFVDNSLLAEYLKSFDILVAPYSSNCSIINHISPLKIFEYLALEKPIIVADIQRVTEIIPDTCVYYYKTDNVDDFSQKIKKAYKEHTINYSLAKKISKENSWENRAKHIIRKW